jgi:hypothetical protein
MRWLVDRESEWLTWTGLEGEPADQIDVGGTLSPEDASWSFRAGCLAVGLITEIDEPKYGIRRIAVFGDSIHLG